MKCRPSINNQQGFTLIEIIAVLVLLGILAAVAVPKYMDLTDDAKNKALDAGIAEMNSRESMVWGKVKLAAGGWTADTDVTGNAVYSTDLGADYAWTAGPDAAGGTLSFQSGTGVALTRNASTVDSPATWTR